MDDAETGLLCPGMHEGGWLPSLLGTLTKHRSSQAGSMSSSKFNVVLMNSLRISLIPILHTGLNYTLNYGT